MKLRRTSFLLAGSLLVATLLTSLGYSEPVLYQDPEAQLLDREAPNKPPQPSPEVIAAWANECIPSSVLRDAVAE